MTFEQFQEGLIEIAMLLQGSDYFGDDYYRQECWRDYFDNGYSAEQAVIEDLMS
jgi:hypothetical protein